MFFLLIGRPPRSTRTDTLFPYTPLFRSGAEADVFCVQSGFLERHDNSRFEGYDAIPGATAAPDRATSGHPWPARGSCLRAMLAKRHDPPLCPRSEEHTSELQSLMRISYAVFCLKKKQTDK